MVTYDALTTRGDNPQTWAGQSDCPDHPFNRPFEERYDWILLKEGLASLENAKRYVSRHLDALERERDRLEFEKGLKRS